VRSFIAQRFSAQQRGESDSALARFRIFCQQADARDIEAYTLGNALFDAYLRFLMHVFDQGRQAATVVRLAGALSLGLRAYGFVEHDCDLSKQPATESLHAVMRRQRPKIAKLKGKVPFDPVALVRTLDEANDFASVRLRALVLLRMETLLRPGEEPASILLKSVRDIDDSIGRAIVVFTYESKTSRRSHLESDSNYVSHICERERDVPRGSLIARSVHCPACCVVELHRQVAVLCKVDDSTHLFTNNRGKPLSADRCASLVRDSMQRAGIGAPFTAHSLRNAVNHLLMMRGVRHEDICIRAGWATQSINRTRVQHYSQFRLVPQNFARVLLLSAPGIGFQS
jgi:hypothetical protein